MNRQEKMAEYEDIDYLEKIDTLGSFKDKSICSGKINVSKNQIEEVLIGGVKTNTEPVSISAGGFREEMRIPFSEIYISDEDNHLLSPAGMLEAFATGKTDVSVSYWAKLRETGKSVWVETRYRLMERQDTGDVIAIYYNRDLTKNKLNVGLRNYLITHSYERSAAVFVRDRKVQPIIELSATYGFYGKDCDYDEWIDSLCNKEIAPGNAKRTHEAMQLDTVLRNLEEQNSYTVEYNICDENGVERRKQVDFSYMDREYGVILITRTDIALYDKLRHMSTHDSLTGLLNRESFFQQAKEMITNNPEETYVFLHIDIEQFKLFNSAFGNEEGNRLLQKTADILRQTIGSYDHCAYGRMQSDVFGFCAPYNREILLKNLEYVNRGIRDFKTDYLIRFVFGVYLIKDGKHFSLENASTKAAIAAKKCKNNVNENYCIYNDKEDEKQKREQRINGVMRTALEEKQFKVYLQPKYDLKTEKPCGAEALVRWLDPKEGLVSPGVFIPLFERNGFIANLDQYMWEEVCILLRKWLDAGYQPNPVSVNISRISLYNPNLVQILVRLVNKYNLNPNLLHLEITESAYMSNQIMMRDTIDALHKEGFIILMDDFGSGYSSLNTLKDFHIDVLKIDMKFLPENRNIKRAEIILASVIHMAKWLGMKVIMEGVETKEQNTFLKAVDCDCIQGYYYARPMPAKEYEDNYVCVQVQPEKERTASELESLPEIIVVEDDKMQQEIFKKFLANEYKLSIFPAAEPALAYLQKNHSNVRLIISDNYLAGMHGMDLFEICKMDKELQRIPKLLVTGDCDEQSIIDSLGHGVDDYLCKPISRQMLVAYVEKWMRISSAFDYKNF